MLLRITALIATLALLNPSTAPAKSKEHGPDGLLARLSYSRTGMEGPSPNICFAVYSDGYYRMIRRSTAFVRHGDDGLEVLEGTLSQDQLVRLGTLLKGLDFQNREVATIHKSSESLTAEVVREGKMVPSVWVDPDHERPFPDSAVRVINWLEDFKAQGAAPLTLRELSDQSICPAASEKTLHPVIVSVDGMSEGARQPSAISASTR